LSSCTAGGFSRRAELLQSVICAVFNETVLHNAMKFDGDDYDGNYINMFNKNKICLSLPS
jgi:hypothetical protein